MIKNYFKKDFFKSLTMLLPMLFTIALAASPDCPILGKNFQGLNNGDISDSSPDGWNLDRNNVLGAEYFAVRSNRLLAENLGGEGIWYSKEFSAQGYSDFQVSVKVHSEGDMNSSEYVKIFYKIDGGSEILLDERSGNFGTLDFISEELNGSKIQLIVKLYNYDNGGSQTSKYYIEEYKLFKEKGPCETSINVTASAENNGVLSCNFSALQLFAVTNATSPSFSWSGPNFHSTEQNPLVSAPGTYVVEVFSDSGTTSASVTVTVSLETENVLWFEDFNLSDGTTNDSGDTSWSLQNIGSGTFSVQNNELKASFNSVNEGIWKSEVINISGQSNIKISTLLRSEVSDDGTTFEVSDFIKVSYILDSGSEQVFFTDLSGLGDTSTTTGYATAISPEINGETLEVIVRLKNSYNDENYFLDDVKVIGSIPDSGGLEATAVVEGELSCSVRTVLIRGESSDNNVSYHWEGPAGFNSDNQNIETGTPGSYTLIITNSSGCSDTTSIVLEEGNFVSPQVHVSASGVLSCSVNSITLQGSSTSSNVSYSWSGPNGFSSSDQNPQVSQAGIYILEIVDSVNGCSNSESIEVTSVISGEQIIWNENFDDLSNGTTQDNGDTAWNIDTSGIQSGFMEVSENKFVINGSDFDSSIGQGIWFSEVIDISSFSDLQISLEAEGIGSLDSGQDYFEVYYKVNDGNEIRFVNEDGDGAFPLLTYSSPTFSGNTVQIIVRTKSTGDSEFYFFDNIKLMGNGVVNIEAIAQVDGVLSCTQPEVTINGSATVDNPIYSWTGPNGFTSSSQNITVSTAGDYTLTVSNSGCSDAVTVTVEGSAVVPDIMATVSGSLECAVSSVTLIGNSTTPNVSYQWTGPNNFISNSKNTEATLAGEYLLTVTDLISNCSSSATVIVNSTIGETESIVWLEDFEDISNGTDIDTGATAWTIQNVNGNGTFEVSNNRFIVSNIGSGNEGVWSSETINITGFSKISISADICSSGGMENSGGNLDYLRLYYKLNGQTEILFSESLGSINGNVGIINVSEEDLNGTTVQIIARSTTTDPSEIYYLDNIEVKSTEIIEDIQVEASVSGILSCSVENVQLTANSTAANVSYTWTGPNGFTADSRDIDVSIAGLYTITVAVPNGCSAMDTIEVEENKEDPTISASVDGVLDCTILSVQLLGSSTTADVSYTWIGPNDFNVNAQNAEVSVAGSYTLTVTALNGCFATETIEVEGDQDIPDISASVDGVLDCNTLVVQLSGSSTTPNVSYSWTDPNGVTTNSQTLAASVAGSYTLTVTALNGCFATETIEVEGDQDIPDISASVDGVLDCNTLVVQLSGSSTTPNVSYSWTDPNGVTTNSQTLAASVAGSYTLTVTALNGCFATETIEVEGDQDIPDISASVDGVLDCNTLVVQLSGSSTTPNVSYSWTDPNGVTTNSQTLAASVAGSYTLTVTALNGCFATETIEVEGDQDIPDISASVDGVLDCNTLVVQLSGSSTTPNVSYSWTDPNGVTTNSQTLAASVAGSYTLRVERVNGCFATETIEVEGDQDIPDISASVDGVLDCNTLVVQLSGSSTTPNVSYSWTDPNGVTTNSQTLAASVAGSYTLRVERVNGCFATETIEVEGDQDIPDISASVDGVLDCNTLVVQLSGSSTTPNVSYSWTDPNGVTTNSQTLAASVAGSYTLRVERVNGCFATETIEVEGDQDIPDISASVDGVLDCNTLVVQLSGSSTTPNVSYSWTDPNGVTTNSQTLAASVAGSYTLRVERVNGCFATETIEVEGDQDIPDISASVDGVLDCNTLVVQLLGSSTTADVSYTWTGPNDFNVNAQNVEVSVPGEYTLTVTALNGCSVKENVEVSSTISGGREIIWLEDFEDLANGAISDIGVTSWSLNSNGRDGRSTVNSNKFRTYGVGGESVWKSQVIDISSFSNVSITMDFEANGSLELNQDYFRVYHIVDGATEDLFFDHSTNSTLSKISSLSLTGNTVQIVIRQFNTGSDEEYLFDNVEVTGTRESEIDVTATVNGVLTCDLNEVVISGSSSIENVTYLWTGPNSFTSNRQNITVDIQGDYILTVTSIAGCTGTTIATVTREDTLPEVSITATNNGVIDCNELPVELTAISNVADAIIRWEGFTENQNPITVSEAGIYTVFVENPTTGCITDDLVIVTREDTLPEVSITATNNGVIDCNELPVELTAISNVADAIIRWEGFTENQNPITVSEAGIYTVFVENPTTGCITDDLVIVTREDTLPEVSITATNNGVIDCNELPVELTAISNVADAIIRWEGFTENQNPITVSEAGIYTVFVENPTTGCITDDLVIVTREDTLPEVSITATNNGVIDCNELPVELTAISNVADAIIRWEGFTENQNPITVSEAGIYTVFVENPTTGCITDDLVIVTREDTLPEVSITATNNGVIDCNELPVELTAISNVADAIIRWEGFTENQNPITVSEAGIYTVFVENPTTGCITDDLVIVTREDTLPEVSITATNNGVIDCNELPVELTAISNVADAIIRWEGFTENQNPITVSEAGIYTVFVENPTTGCITDDLVIVTREDTLPEVSITATNNGVIDCNELPVELTAISNVADAIIRWEGFTENQNPITVSEAGIYTVFVENPTTGCITDDLVIVTREDTLPEVSITATNNGVIDCNELPVELTAISNVADAIIRWEGFTENQNPITVSEAGIYTVFVENPTTGCITDDLVIVTREDTLPEVSITATNNGVIDCNELPVELTAISNVADAIIRWEGFTENQNPITVSEAGIYTVFVENPTTGCITDDLVIVTREDTLPEVSITATNNGVIDCNELPVELTAISNVADAIIRWEGFTENQNPITVSEAGIYTVFVENPTTGCITDDLVIVTREDTLPEVSITATNNGVIDCNELPVELTAISNVADAIIRWEGFTENQNPITVSEAGIYTVFVENPTTGCITDDLVIVTREDTLPEVSITATNNGVIDCNELPVELTAISNVADAIIRWEGFTENQNPITVSEAGIYTVFVENPTTGCITDDLVIVTREDTLPEVSITATNNGVIDCNELPVELTAISNVADAIIRWEGFTENQNPITVSEAGIYTVFVENPTTGCITDDLVIVTREDTLPEVSITATNNGVIDCNELPVELTAISNVADAIIRWEGFTENQNPITVSEAGIYTVFVENPTTGCITDDLVIVTREDTLPEVSITATNNGVIDCNELPVELTAISNVADAIIRWEGFTENQNPITVSEAGIYTVFVENPTTGCITDDLVIVTREDTLPEVSITATNNGVIDCNELPVELTAISNVADAIIRWEGFTENQNPITVSEAGIYTVFVENPTTGCITDDLVIVTREDTLPEVSITATNNGVIDCNELPVELTAISNVADAIIRWEGFTENQNPITVSEAGIYTVFVENPTTGCITDDLVIVTREDTLPEVSITATNNGVIDCNELPVELTAISNVADAIIRWEGFTENQNPITVSEAGIYTVFVENPTTGCITDDLVIVTREDTLPEVSITATNNGVIDCNELPVELTAISNVADAIIRWEGFTENQNPITVSEAGIYTVFVENPTTGCITDDLVIVTREDTLPEVSITATNNGVIDCNELPVELTAISNVADAIIRWEGFTENQNPITVSEAGIYTVFVENPTTGCITDDLVIVTREDTLPEVSITATNNGVIDCNELPVELTAISNVADAIIRWEGFTENQNPITVSEAGIYTVFVENPTTGCITDDLVIVTREDTLPEVSITATNNGVIDCNELPVELTAISNVADAIIRWEGFTENQNPITVSEAGIYTVFVENPTTGCITDDLVIVTREDTLPEVSITATNNGVIDCNELPVELTAISNVADAIIRWEGFTENQNPITVSEAGIYTVFVENPTTGCITDDLVIVTRENTLPEFEVSNECVNGIVSLEAFSDDTSLKFNWVGFPEGQNPIFVTAAGLYRVEAVNESTGCVLEKRIPVNTICDDFSESNISLGNVVSDPIEETFEVLVFPNPAKKEVNVAFTSSKSEYVRVEIYSLAGVLIRTLMNDKIDPLKNYNLKFNENGELPSGMYICYIVLKNKTIVKKIILSE
ncbi:T9SS type A sorting domain-containing protein [Aquimarina sp. LLG6339-5]|uniref:T9SS type A sorting domain-containing protein n=1 Tax=Aquimarina sp. LLG6339-5 TaxID=3160830 RepID=UPI003862D4BD